MLRPFLPEQEVPKKKGWSSIFHFHLYHSSLSWIIDRTIKKTPRTAINALEFGKYLTAEGPTAAFLDLFMHVFLRGKNRNFLFFQTSTFLQSRLYAVDISSIRESAEYVPEGIRYSLPQQEAMLASALGDLPSSEATLARALNSKYQIPESVKKHLSDEIIDKYFMRCFERPDPSNLGLNALQVLLVKYCLVYANMGNAAQNILRGRTRGNASTSLQEAKYYSAAHDLVIKPCSQSDDVESKVELKFSWLFCSDKTLKIATEKAVVDAVTHLIKKGEKTLNCAITKSEALKSFTLQDFKKLNYQHCPDEATLEKIVEEASNQKEKALSLGTSPTTL